MKNKDKSKFDSYRKNINWIIIVYPVAVVVLVLLALDKPGPEQVNVFATFGAVLAATATLLVGTATMYLNAKYEHEKKESLLRENEPQVFISSARILTKKEWPRIKFQLPYKLGSFMKISDKDFENEESKFIVFRMANRGSMITDIQVTDILFYLNADSPPIKHKFKNILADKYTNTFFDRYLLTGDSVTIVMLLKYPESQRVGLEMVYRNQRNKPYKLWVNFTMVQHDGVSSIIRAVKQNEGEESKAVDIDDQEE